MRQCLLLETKDQRTFFTHKKNFPMLIEFSKTFGANISVVELKEKTEILDLVDLAPAICDSSFKQKANYEVIEKKVKNRSTRSIALKIRQYIRTQFINGQIVGPKLVAEKFKEYKLTSACFYGHFTAVRNELKKEGREVKKVSCGKYQLSA